MIVCATGFFDGVHAGHRQVIKALVHEAKATNRKSAIISFWPHPRNVLQMDADQLRLLNTLEEKETLLHELGVDEFHVICFTRDFSKLSSKQFMEQYLRNKYDVSTLVIGYDHRLGSSNDLSHEDMIREANVCGIEVLTVPEHLMDKNKIVSSTRIRNFINAGEIEVAAEMLGYYYNMRGVIVTGNRIGRTIGYPTANMALYEPLKLIPGNGVYLVKVNIIGQEKWGICNVGVRPTISKNNARTIETNILDFDEDVYGLDMKISFIKHIRPEKKFNDLEALKRQITDDKSSAKLIIENFKE
ncbi:MAG: bifunctional riboflavin kinase/FAD synthetase [Bacteroidales bacterium]